MRRSGSKSPLKNRRSVLRKQDRIRDGQDWREQSAKDHITGRKVRTALFVAVGGRQLVLWVTRENKGPKQVPGSAAPGAQGRIITINLQFAKTT